MTLTLSHTARGQLPWLLAAICPVVLVQAIRFLGQSPLGETHAATIADPMSFVELVQPPPPESPAQRAAIEWLRLNRVDSALTLRRDPFYILKEEPPAPQIVVLPTPIAPVVVTPAPPDPIPKFDVRSLVGNGSGAIARINHKVCRVGDEVAPGWTLLSVDSRARSVTLQDDRGRIIDVTASTGRDH